MYLYSEKIAVICFLILSIYGDNNNFALLKYGYFIYYIIISVSV